ncbi:MAG: hypothetical protein KC656_20395 [Myxococcales bacterium]|nr:hypothetical protein [Myxococcales bacterium]
MLRHPPRWVRCGTFSPDLRELVIYALGPTEVFLWAVMVVAWASTRRVGPTAALVSVGALAVLVDPTAAWLGAPPILEATAKIAVAALLARAAVGQEAVPARPAGTHDHVHGWSTTTSRAATLPIAYVAGLVLVLLQWELLVWVLGHGELYLLSSWPLAGAVVALFLLRPWAPVRPRIELDGRVLTVDGRSVVLDGRHTLRLPPSRDVLRVRTPAGSVTVRGSRPVVAWVHQQLAAIEPLGSPADIPPELRAARPRAHSAPTTEPSSSDPPPTDPPAPPSGP